MERLDEWRETDVEQRNDVGHLGGREDPLKQEGRPHSQLVGARAACRLSFCPCRPSRSQRLLENRRGRGCCQDEGGLG